MTVDSMFTSFIGFVHVGTSTIRDLIEKLIPNYAVLVILGLSLLGGWYISNKVPKPSDRWFWLIYGLIIFLLIQFV